MSVTKLIRAWFNFNFREPDYRVWQCAKLSRGKVGSACQRFKGHVGKHIDYHGDAWK